MNKLKTTNNIRQFPSSCQVSHTHTHTQILVLKNYINFFYTIVSFVCDSCDRRKNFFLFFLTTNKLKKFACLTLFDSLIPPPPHSPLFHWSVCFYWNGVRVCFHCCCSEIQLELLFHNHAFTNRVVCPNSGQTKELENKTNKIKI